MFTKKEIKQPEIVFANFDEVEAIIDSMLPDGAEFFGVDMAKEPDQTIYHSSDLDQAYLKTLEAMPDKKRKHIYYGEVDPAWDAKDKE